jgi:iron complex outermembrane receptor protein
MKPQFSKKKIALLCGVVFSLASTHQALAQNSQSTVIVSGSRFEENLNEVPADVKVITREEIANSTSTDIPQVLSQIGGLSVSNSTGGSLNLDSTVDMGGFGATAGSTTLIMVDGQRMNPADSSSVNWESIPIDSIERIEIVQGGASVQYGNGAVGGVINIITNGGAKNINQASATYGSNATLINNAILRNTVDNTTLQLTANTSNTNGWRQNSAANAYSLDAKVTQSLGGKDNAYIDGFISHSNAQIPGGVVGQVGQGNIYAAKFNNIGETNTVDNAGLRAGISKAINDQYTVEVDGSYSNKTTNFNQPYYSTPYYASMGYNSYTLNPSWQMAISPRLKANFGSWGTTVVGYDYSQESQSSSSGSVSQYSLQQNVNLSNQSVYVISRIPVQLVDGMEATGGFRRQTQYVVANNFSASDINGNTYTANANRTNSANAGDLALNYNYEKGQKVFVKWDQSYRFANTNEYWGFDPITYASIFTGILNPQITQALSAGGEWHLDALRLSSSIFSSITSNEIRYDPTSGNNINTPDNINRRGILLDSSYNITPALTIAGGGKYQKSYFANGQLSGIGVAISPDLLLNARVNYLVTPSWNIGAVANYVGNQYYDADPAISNTLAVIPSSVVADIYTSYKVDSWEAKLMIKNVGNANYATYGRYGYVSMPDGTSQNAYSYIPGSPRSYFITAKYTFN